MPQQGEVWPVDLGLAQKTRPDVNLNVPHGDTDRVVVALVSCPRSSCRLPIPSFGKIPSFRPLRSEKAGRNDGIFPNYGIKDFRDTTLVSHTTSLRGSPFEITVPVPFLREGAFAVQSVTTIPARHALRRLGVLTPEQLAPIEQGVRMWLGL